MTLNYREESNNDNFFIKSSILDNENKLNSKIDYSKIFDGEDSYFYSQTVLHNNHDTLNHISIGFSHQGDASSVLYITVSDSIDNIQYKTLYHIESINFPYLYLKKYPDKQSGIKLFYNDNYFSRSEENYKGNNPRNIHRSNAENFLSRGPKLLYDFFQSIHNNYFEQLSKLENKYQSHPSINVEWPITFLKKIDMCLSSGNYLDKPDNLTVQARSLQSSGTIKGIRDPTNPHDVTRKRYLDNHHRRQKEIDQGLRGQDIIQG